MFKKKKGKYVVVGRSIRSVAKTEEKENENRFWHSFKHDTFWIIYTMYVL